MFLYKFLVMLCIPSYLSEKGSHIYLVEKITNYYNTLFKNKSSENDEGKEDNLSVQNQITNLQAEAQLLKDKIEGLLPGATSAGLAGSYFDAKARYHLSSVEKDGWLARMRKGSKNLFSNILLYALFIIPIAFLVLNSFEVYDSIKDIGSKETDNSTSISASLLFIRFLVALPLGLISWFGFSSIRLRHRLFEEYNHKQRVIELYEGFDREITNNGTEEQKRKLIDIMLDVVSKNPAELILHNVSLGSYLFGKDDKKKSSTQKDNKQSNSTQDEELIDDE